jgi:hypothetical protein
VWAGKIATTAASRPTTSLPLSSHQERGAEEIDPSALDAEHARELEEALEPAIVEFQ